jgi:hypothetical protein
MAYTISRKSWHWKLYEFHNDFFLNNYVSSRETVCLCPYVRTLLFWFPAACLVSLALVCVFVASIGFALYQIWSVPEGRLVLGGIAGAILVVILAARKEDYIADKVYEARTAWRKRRGTKKPQPSLFGEWLKAKHEKICPCFEVRD